MIGALTLRGAMGATRSRTTTRSGARRRVPRRVRARAYAAPRHGRSTSRRRVTLDASARLFGLSAGALAVAFLTALVYLRFATSIAATGYDLHDLEGRRDELVRQNQLLRLTIDRLEAPARIETEAQRIGLVKASQTLFLTAGASVTLR